MTATADTAKPFDRNAMAARLARDIPEGWYVNLGLGLPTLIPDYISDGREVIFHSENGVLGMGPVPPKDAIDTWLINATKQNVTLLKGASLFHHGRRRLMTRFLRSAAPWTSRPDPSGSGC